MMRNEMRVGVEEGNGGSGLKGICEGTNSRLCENDKVCDSMQYYELVCAVILLFCSWTAETMS
ncbi:hypothetical protein RchiOBHm_Chr6g0305331 [Rosa chinensis]|uniref:Uncharacterized protein n=1 Tax=Rosa chinensis TaxID=74649 RepID=A0A2P6PZW2_ROSCH|nr:hypothetical protein RchiOBHm_Chr6g0305331 [Rosa chinensis]